MKSVLREVQRIPTSGARAVEWFQLDGLDLLAIPQLAYDVPGAPAGMNAGDSDTSLLLMRRVEGRFSPYAELPGPGGEDAEFFRIGERAFLAVACIRTGAGPYQFATESLIYEWVDGAFQLFQGVSSMAAKQFRHWQWDGRHFLGLAQGLALPGIGADNRDSLILEWDGTSFVEFQAIPSTWAYNWHPFEADGQLFVAHADHSGPSVLYRWQGERYVPHQELLPHGGRAFAHYHHDGSDYLVAASIDAPPTVMELRDGVFDRIRTLEGPGARELRMVEVGGRDYLVRVNFITGTPADPKPSLTSQIYAVDGADFLPVAEFATSGGTDVEPIAHAEGSVQFVVSNALSGDVRFATETVVYDFEPRNGVKA